jgi:hypothetical protein
MTRLAITVEDYQSSKIVRASLLYHDEESVTSEVLTRMGLPFKIETVRGPLYNFRLDDDKVHVDLQLQTIHEISEWIKREPFQELTESFLLSGSELLRLAVDRTSGCLEISRQEN